MRKAALRAVGLTVLRYCESHAFGVSPIIGHSASRFNIHTTARRCSGARGRLDMKRSESHALIRSTAAAIAAIQIALAGVSAGDVRGVPPAASASPLLVLSEQKQEVTAAAEKISSGPFQEAWELSNKFFFDTTHRGNEWEEVRKRLAEDIASGRKSEKKATEEMLALLQDKYTRLISPEIYDSLSKYDLVGVGVMLSPNREGQLAVAAPPKAKSQAAGAGVRKGDLISGINGMPTASMTSFDVIDFLSKYKGKTLTFELKSPEEGSQPRTVQLDRTFQAVENPVAFAVKDQGEHKVGYTRVSEFNAVVTDRLKDALNEMKAAGADEYVLDLRGNGGGAFQSALGIAGLFMENQPITYVVDGAGKRAEFITKSPAVLSEEPLVVWVDGGSASASEVLAGALRDDCRAVLRGKTTFGKGLVQAVYGLTDGSGLIITVAQYETPRGNYIHGKGIDPDIVGGLPLKILSTAFSFDQGQFDMARERMRSCPPMQPSRAGLTAEAGASVPL